jgi:hypothetical protein
MYIGVNTRREQGKREKKKDNDVCSSIKHTTAPNAGNGSPTTQLHTALGAVSRGTIHRLRIALRTRKHRWRSVRLQKRESERFERGAL